MQQYYVYQHVRLDTNTIFYIGIGKKHPPRTRGHRTEFSRAYERAKRSDFWKNVASKTKIRVDILFQSDDLDFIKQKEIALIKLYGRKCCDENGILVNFQEGGEFRGGSTKGVSINQLNLDGSLVRTWKKVKLITEEKGWSKSNIVGCCRGRQVTAYGYKWRYADGTTYKFQTRAKKRTTNLGVGMICTNRKTMEVLEFRTLRECAEYFGLHPCTIHRYLLKTTKHKTHDIRHKTWEEHPPVK